MYLFPLEAHLSAEVSLGPAHLEQHFPILPFTTKNSESNSEVSIGLSPEYCPQPLQNIHCGISKHCSFFCCTDLIKLLPFPRPPWACCRETCTGHRQTSL